MVKDEPRIRTADLLRGFASEDFIDNDPGCNPDAEKDAEDH